MASPYIFYSHRPYCRIVSILKTFSGVKNNTNTKRSRIEKGGLLYSTRWYGFGMRLMAARKFLMNSFIGGNFNVSFRPQYCIKHVMIIVIMRWQQCANDCEIDTLPPPSLNFGLICCNCGQRLCSAERVRTIIQFHFNQKQSEPSRPTFACFITRMYIYVYPYVPAYSRNVLPS